MRRRRRRRTTSAPVHKAQTAAKAMPNSSRLSDADDQQSLETSARGKKDYRKVATVRPMGIDAKLYLFNPRAYHEKFVPAMKALEERNDIKPLVKLIEEVLSNPRIGETKTGHWIRDSGVDSLKENLRILQGNYDLLGWPKKKLDNPKEFKFALDNYVKNNVTSYLIRLLCILEYGSPKSEQDVGRNNNNLTAYFYEHSKEIEDFLAGGWSNLKLIDAPSTMVLLEKEHIKNLLDDVQKIPRPLYDTGMGENYDNLVQLLKRALADNELALVLILG